MKKSLCLLAAAFAMIAAGETKLGKPLEAKETIGIDKLMADPDAWVGRTVQVKGRATDVCQMMGCWTVLADPATGKSVRIKVKDGEIVFPKDLTGKTVLAEGKFSKQVLTREQAVAQARQEAEENKRKFDPASIKSGVTIYQVQGSGAVILD
jgi:hypothetical protein